MISGSNDGARGPFGITLQYSNTDSEATTTDSRPSTSLSVATASPTVTLTPTFTPTNTPTDTPTPTPTDTPTPTPTPTNTPTNTPTATPTNTPTPTPTDMPPPYIEEVQPHQGTNDVPNDITIEGEHFMNGAVVILGTSPPITLTHVIRLDTETLRATIPAGLASGTYNLRVVNPDGDRSNPRPYTVVDPVTEDDLYSTNYELYTDPVSIHAGDQVGLYLTVHRQGGEATLANIAVRFYDGNPFRDGVLIGEGQVFFLEPDGSQNTTPVNWDTTGQHGWHVIYAVIDPDNKVTETVERNNIVRREIKVKEPPGDKTAPVVTAFEINGGAEVTYSPDVTLEVRAKDNAGGSGMDAMFFVELLFNQAVLQWVPVQGSGWLPYSNHYDWTLLDSAGMHYLQAWAADKAGNISLYPMKARINYVPTTDHIEANQVRLYRQKLTAGQRLTVTVSPTSGDPDLYVWSPDSLTPPWFSILSGTEPDQVSFVADQDGIYQIEVYGYTAADYTISIEVTNGATFQGDAEPESGTITGPNASKTPRSQPVTGVNDEPAGQMAVPAAEMCFDIDGNDQVDVSDVQKVAADWQQDAGAPYDVDQSGLVTVVDVMRVVSQWGKSCVCRDIDGDNVVAEGDLSRMASEWRQDAGPVYDLDLNGLVNILDLMELTNSWGQTCQ